MILINLNQVAHTKSVLEKQLFLLQTRNNNIPRYQDYLNYLIFVNKQDLVEKAQSIDSIAEQLMVPKSKIVMGNALLNKGIFETLDKLLDEIVGDPFLI